MTAWRISVTIHQVGDLTDHDIETIAVVDMRAHLNVRLLGFHHSAQEHTLRAQLLAPGATMGQALDATTTAVEDTVFPLLPDACHITHARVDAHLGQGHPHLNAHAWFAEQP